MAQINSHDAKLGRIGHPSTGSLKRIETDLARMAAEVPSPRFTDNLATLIASGLLSATIPERVGGIGLCNEAAAPTLFDLFEHLGEVDLSLGRVFEAHVNALDLIRRYGTDAQFDNAGRLAADGVLFALWVTDPPLGGASLTQDAGGVHLAGSKHFCSAANLAGRAVITAATTNGTRLILIDTASPMTVTASSIGLSGMHAAATGSISLNNMSIAPDAIIGDVDDYLREPVFSAAAWRNYAVMLGGVRRLIAVSRAMLQAKDRTGNAFQRIRFGEAVIAYQTAHFWLREAARRAEAATGPGEDVVAYVNLARIAAETSCLQVIQLVQRSLGVSAFIEGSMVEKLARDLSVYLRQPAPDEALDRAAGFCLDHLSDRAVVP
jgi:alkylation response protein AidB-like acyl-CoA dehydrogenase